MGSHIGTSCVPLDDAPEGDRPTGALGEAQGEMRGTSRLVESGQEPASTHDMDDDEIDLTEEVETSSDQSN